MIILFFFSFFFEKSPSLSVLIDERRLSERTQDVMLIQGNYAKDREWICTRRDENTYTTA